MKILVVTQYYWPENSRVTELAESLINEGNSVTVLTGLPNYPQGFIYNGYKKKTNWDQEHNGVHIIRAKLIERRHDLFHRLLNYYSFPFYATKKAKRLKEKFDIVLAIEESPIMLVKPAIAYSKKHNIPLVMYEMDLWPESLLAGGIRKNSWIYNHFKRVSSKLYSKFDLILTSTKEHIDYIRNLRGCSDIDFTYLPQYAESVFEKFKFSTISNGVIDLMFAGNIGKGQSIGTIIKAANILKREENIKFHIIGCGSELENIQNMVNELRLTNVVFYGQKNVEEMPRLYEIADAMLVTLENKEYANLTIPGKIQSYMAAGKIIVGAVNGSCSSFITNNHIGSVCEAENYIALANIILQLNEEKMRTVGENSRKVYFEKYSKKIFINSLNSNLLKCLKNSKRNSKLKK